AKGIHEDFKPTITMVKKYHNHCNIFDNPKTLKTVEDEDLSWCSSYVSWCLDQTDYKGVKHAGSRFYIADDDKWNGTGKDSKNLKHKAKDMLVKVSEPLYGSLAVFSDCSKEGVIGKRTGGHIGFVFGTVEGSASLAILGGNQSSKIKISPFNCSSDVFISWKQKNKVGKVIKIYYKKLRGFYMPKGYKEGVPLDETNHYKSFKEANLKATTIKIKTSKDGEST
ncbi:MAG: CHAP domain-containing protein, partial [Sulfurimonas sp.]|nr:CHAP domain-containing protein [Sulfurimonas sp.]